MRYSLLARIALGAGLFCGGGQANAAKEVQSLAHTQHLLRRFAFSASPEQTAAVQAEGATSWLAQQENWTAINDSGSTLEQPPAQLNADGSYPDYYVYERILMQHLVLTPRVLQAKVELHWLDHFSVSLATVLDPAIMAHYEQTVRANALGNFGTLLAAAAQEPAMLYWLNNNNNLGSMPNENFAREVMQLYSIGIYQLNMDGSTKLDGNGQPHLNYTEADIHAIAQAITGYGVVIDPDNMDPQTRFSVNFTAANHYNKPVTFLGRSRHVPNSVAALNFVANVLAHHPSAAPFMAREMLQRFVTENPSPQFIGRIAAVWAKQVDAPDQISQVINAIVNDPEFDASYHGMLKQPVELVLGALHQLPGTLQVTSTSQPAAILLWELHYVGQQLYYPPSVFSFYTPGSISTTLNTSTALYRTSVFANMVNGVAGAPGMDTYIDIPALRQRIGNTDALTIANYLLGDTLDGGTAPLRTQLVQFLGPAPSDNQIRGAMWVLLNSPTYAVN